MYEIQKIITPLPEQACFEAKNFEQMVDKEFFITLLGNKIQKKISAVNQELRQLIPTSLEPVEGVIYEVISRQPKHAELFLLGEIRETADSADKPFSAYIFRDLSEDYIFKIKKVESLDRDLPVLKGTIEGYDLSNDYLTVPAGNATITLAKVFPYKKKFRISLFEQEEMSYDFD